MAKKKKDVLIEAILVHFARLEATKQVKIRGKNEYRTAVDIISDVFVIFLANEPEALELRRVGLEQRGFQEVGRFRLLPSGGAQIAGLPVRLPKTGTYETCEQLWLEETKNEDQSK